MNFLITHIIKTHKQRFFWNFFAANNLEGNNLIPLIDPISVTERSYILPGTTTGGNPNYMLYPMIIALNRNLN